MDFNHHGLASEAEMDVANDIADALRKSGDYRRVSLVTDKAESETDYEHEHAHFVVETEKDVEYVITVTLA